MVSLRKASSYSKKYARPFTRNSKRRNKSYIKTIPGNKIVKFDMGDKKAFAENKHKFSVSFIAGERAQIRDNALEACRTLVNKVLDSKIKDQYYFGIKVFPHHLLRDNKTAAGAGADRLSSGMKHSFGIVIGRAAIVKPGQIIFLITTTTEAGARIAREALKTVSPKVPCKGKVKLEKLEK
jgi:large subunit ribosomal protein L10e